MTYREKALQLAVKELGVVESPAGSNSGTRVRQYQAATSLGGTGWPWCAAFVNWCYREAGDPLDELNRSASVAIMLSEAKQRGWAHRGPAQRGDIACYDWESMNGPGKVIGDDHVDHMGIVRSVLSTGGFHAVEGNTAFGDDSNGGKVMDRIRSQAQVEGYIRVPGIIPETWYWYVLVDMDGNIQEKSERVHKAGISERALSFVSNYKGKIARMAANGRRPRILLKHN